jgi:TRAP-type C4-dicarboxylate transport system substrate-binding protein
MLHLTTALIVVKIATLAPEGSSWLKLFHRWQETVEQRSDGRIRFKFYTGGAQGDEKDMLRKMRAGQLGGAAVTGIGLATISPEVRVFEVCRNYQELDRARGRLDGMIRKRFEERGFVLVGWADVGPVHLFSQRPIRSLAEAQATKMWMFSDDPLTRKGFEVLGIHGVPLGIPEVLPALATGTIDTFFGAPLSTLALQWSTHAKFVTSAVIGQATGAVVIYKPVWDGIQPADRQLLIDSGRELQSEMLTQVRKDNETAMAAMKARGLQTVDIPKAFETDMMVRAGKIALTNMDMITGEIDKLNTAKEFQIAVRGLLEEYRDTYPPLGPILDEYDRLHGLRRPPAKK